ncbi:MAG TPA: type II toxin-antitoxin system VapC family toxin [Terracidiphilus sp.]|jgi:ribonuclease VapC
MIVDTSAIIAILKNEPEAESFANVIETADIVRVSAATFLETHILVDRYRKPLVAARLEDVFSSPIMHIEPVTVEQARIARQAYRDYGKGSGHPAKLNFGDCFSYALAREKREPILFKGDDFVHTDLRSALNS